NTQGLDRPTSCYHNTLTREVFISDGYGNRRVIAFNADTGRFTRMWGAYGKQPSSKPYPDDFGNPVHKIAAGPNGHLFVADRAKNRIQEFELVPDGARFIREVTIAPGTGGYGAAYDIAFAPTGGYMYVGDGNNHRVWIVDLETFEVLGSTSVHSEYENDKNVP